MSISMEMRSKNTSYLIKKKYLACARRQESLFAIPILYFSSAGLIVLYSVSSREPHRSCPPVDFGQNRRTVYRFRGILRRVSVFCTE